MITILLATLLCVADAYALLFGVAFLLCCVGLLLFSVGRFRLALLRVVSSNENKLNAMCLISAGARTVDTSNGVGRPVLTVKCEAMAEDTVEFHHQLNQNGLNKTHTHIQYTVAFMVVTRNRRTVSFFYSAQLLFLPFKSIYFKKRQHCCFFFSFFPRVVIKFSHYCKLSVVVGFAFRFCVSFRAA